MSYGVKDKRGSADGNDLERLTDDEIVAIMDYACRDSHLPIPKAVLMGQGIQEWRIEELFKAGRINRVAVQDYRGTVSYHYYPAHFEAYRVNAQVKGSDALKSALDSDTEDVKN